MSIGRGELTDWLKALRDFVDLYNPHLPIFPLPCLRGKSAEMKEKERERERETEREGEKRSRWLTRVVDGGWWNGSYFGNLGSQEWAGIVLTALFSHSVVILYNKQTLRTLSHSALHWESCKLCNCFQIRSRRSSFTRRDASLTIKRQETNFVALRVP